MPNHCVKSNNTHIFRKANVFVFAFFRVFFVPLCLALCLAVSVSAGDTIEFDNGVVTGGKYLNLWHNGNVANSFSYWGYSLIPYGDYQTYDWDGPVNVNRSYELDGNTIIVHRGTVAGSIFGAIDDTLDSRPHDVTNNRIIIYDGQVGARPGDTWVEAYSGNVFAGWSKSGDTLNNRIEIYGGTMLGWVCGGLSDAGNVIGNSVLISGGHVKNSIGDIEFDLTWDDPDGTSVGSLLRTDLTLKMMTDGVAGGNSKW